jgi:predicted small integral membrane protein
MLLQSVQLACKVIATATSKAGNHVFAHSFVIVSSMIIWLLLLCCVTCVVGIMKLHTTEGAM